MTTMLQHFIFTLAAVLLSTTATAIDFKQWKECTPCLAAGYGWCPIRRMCGGFANRKCTGDERDFSKTAAEMEKENEVKQQEKESQANSDVVEIETGIGEFESKLATFEVSLVKFYAPWCGHCKALAPAFKEAATLLKQEHSKAKLVNVDATASANKELAQKFNVKGFPTLKLFRGKEFEDDFSGGRDTHDLMDFMRKAASEASKPRPPMVRVVEFTMQKASKLLKHKINRQLMVFGTKKILAAHREAMDAAGAELGTDGKPNMLILLLNTEDASLRKVLERFQIEFKETGPMYRVADSSSAGGLQALRPKDQDLPKEVTASSLVTLCQHFMDARFHRVLRSATRLPPTPFVNRDVAEEILGNSFVTKVVDDAAHDSVVFFYMPGCGHCKSLQPIYSKIATYMVLDNPNLKFFVMDGTKNEVESADVSGYPTVYFYPRGSKSTPLKMEEREEKGLREFIASHYMGENEAAGLQSKSEL